MQTLLNADKALKSVYLSVIAEQINTNVSPLFSRIKQTTSDIWGKDIKVVAQCGINGGVGAGSETGALPTSGENTYSMLTSTLKNFYGTFSISDKAVRASANNSGAFVNLLNAEMEGLLKAAKFNFGRMLYGDGSGKLATISSVGSNYVVVDSVRNLIEGMIIDIYSTSGQAVTNGTGRRITNIDREAKRVYLSGTAFTSSTLTVPAYMYVQNSKDKELSGLGHIFGNSATMYGLTKSENQWLMPYIKEEVGEITESVIQKAIDTVEEKTGSQINFIVCSSGVKRAFMEHLSTYKRNTDILDLQGGAKAISFNGIPIVADRFCPEGTMYLLNTDDFKLHQLCDWRWLEGEDGKILKQIASTPNYTATLVKYADLICTRPSGQAMLSGITEA